MKQLRQKTILDIVGRGPVASQGDIVRELARAGIEANQATVSRDIQELGLIKVADSGAGHRYAVPSGAGVTSWEEVAATFRDHVSRVDANPLLIVVRTPPGRAHLVCVSIDGLQHDDILGTIAGDDTLLVVPRDEAACRSLVERMQALLSNKRPRP